MKCCQFVVNILTTNRTMAIYKDLRVECDCLYRLGWHGRMTVHGFRHLASTTLRELGYGHHLVEKQLSHEIKNKVEAAYNKAEYLQDRIKMMNKWSKFIESYEGNIIPINFKQSR